MKNYRKLFQNTNITVPITLMDALFGNCFTVETTETILEIYNSTVEGFKIDYYDSIDEFLEYYNMTKEELKEDYTCGNEEYINIVKAKLVELIPNVVNIYYLGYV